MRPDQTLTAQDVQERGERGLLAGWTAEMIERWKQQLIYWHGVYLDDIDRGHSA
jgi:hypothetical protein